MSRALGKLRNRIQSFGKGRATFYAAKRDIRNVGNRIPIFQISEAGNCESIGELYAVAPKGFVGTKKAESLFDVYSDIPFFLNDMRPQGYLGRSYPHRFPELGLPRRLTDWIADDVLEALCRRGADCVGNLVIGSESFEIFQKMTHSTPDAIAASEKSKLRRYEGLANAAQEGDIAGSSAAGEQPKFSVIVMDQKEYRHQLVKFSPELRERSGRRWADLLICEAIASVVLNEVGISASSANFLEGPDRAFLEVSRFDRVGAFGRRGVISLAALDDEWFGRRDSWTSASLRLQERGAITDKDASAMRFLDSFGGLIANTDRHFGNLSFFWNLGAEKVALTPCYDMLPMLYAPVNGEIIGRKFSPELAKAESLEEWRKALPLAIHYWNEVGADKRVSPEFRAIARENLSSLREL